MIHPSPSQQPYGLSLEMALNKDSPEPLDLSVKSVVFPFITALPIYQPSLDRYSRAVTPL